MNEKNIFIVRAGEAALKGENKPYFERMLVERIKKLLKRFDGVEVTRKEGLIFVHADKSIPKEDIIKWVSKAFGVQTISPAVEVESDIEAIGRAAVEYMNGIIAERGVKTFKVKAKRADKQFPIESPDIARQVGAMILKGCKVLKVDVHEPDCYLYVNVRKGISYIYQDKIEGFGGLPLGTNGRGLVLLSGGIDSPVAAFMMARRGMAIETIHFHSYPYTSERAREKVEDIAGQLAVYCSRFKMHIVNLLPVQEEIVRHCPEEETTIHVRMFMMRIAEKIAEKNGCTMLVTGESLGQVASQTAEALVVTNSAVSMPVMRPLIALDKTEIIAIAQEIETFETSIEPYEDCCTVFLPKHPLTKPKKDRILKSESALDIDELVAKAVDSEEIVDIFPKK
jgi:thiazole biosynthesis/tRNA modification protein ThiI